MIFYWVATPLSDRNGEGERVVGSLNCISKYEFLRQISTWNEMDGRVHNYTLIHDSCVKKIFGSVGWRENKLWRR